MADGLVKLRKNGSSNGSELVGDAKPEHKWNRVDPQLLDNAPKFLLIYPPNQLSESNAKKAILPLGVAYLAGTLRDSGVDVDAFDSVIEGIDTHYTYNGTEYYGLTLDEIRQRILADDYDVVGVSWQFSNLSDIVPAITRIAKECGIENVIVGGPHAQAMAREILTDEDSIDVVFMGEAEQSIVEYTTCLAKGDKAGFENIDGIAFRKDDGEIHVASRMSWVQDMDSIPFPARDMFPMEKYFVNSFPMGGVYKSRRNTTMLTSRGCPAKCNFCATTRYWGDRFRFRSAESVLEEMEELKYRWGVEEIQIQDDNYTLNKNRAHRISAEIQKRKLDIWWCLRQGVALWAMTPELIDSMAASGCHYVAAAIESGSQRVLDEVINKPLRLHKVPPLIKRFRERKITVGSFFVIGFPEETLEEVRESFTYAAEAGIDMANFAFATPLPGTPLWTQGKRDNSIVDGFSLKDVRFDRPAMKSPNWSSEELIKLVTEEKRKLYVKLLFKHPKTMLFRVFDMLRQDPKRFASVVYNQLFASSFKNRLNYAPTMATEPFTSGFNVETTNKIRDEDRREGSRAVPSPKRSETTSESAA